jgi:hypothetical protein
LHRFDLRNSHANIKARAGGNEKHGENSSTSNHAKAVKIGVRCARKLLAAINHLVPAVPSKKSSAK